MAGERTDFGSKAFGSVARRVTTSGEKIRRAKCLLAIEISVTGARRAPFSALRWSSLKSMNKLDLTLRLARELHRSRAKAADIVDNLVYELLKKLKQPEAGEPKPKSAEKRRGSQRADA
jgi:hypothetical protein